MAISVLRGARAEPARATADAWLGAAMLVLGAALAAEALLGPLAAGVIRYPVSRTLEGQAIGLDVVSLVLAAPLAVAAGLLALRAHPAGAALAVGVGAYAAYVAVQFAIGPEHTVRPGNSARAFALFLLIFAVGWIAALRAWRLLPDVPPPGAARRDRLVGRYALPALAAIAFGRYLPALLDASADVPADAGYLAGPTFFWIIALLDLGVFLPLTVAACVGLVRGIPWGRRAATLVAGWFGLVGPAVASMAIVMDVRDDPGASTAGSAAMAVLGAAFAALAAAVLVPLVHRSPGDGA